MDRSENFRLNKHTPFLARPICIGQAQGGGDKKRSQDGLRPLIWGWTALMPWGWTFLCLPNKALSCNRAVTLVHHFESLLQWDRTKEITHSPTPTYLVPWFGCKLAETTLARLPRDSGEKFHSGLSVKKIEKKIFFLGRFCWSIVDLQCHVSFGCTAK